MGGASPDGAAEGDDGWLQPQPQIGIRRFSPAGGNGLLDGHGAYLACGTAVELSCQRFTSGNRGRHPLCFTHPAAERLTPFYNTCLQRVAARDLKALEFPRLPFVM